MFYAGCSGTDGFGHDKENGFGTGPGKRQSTTNHSRSLHIVDRPDRSIRHTMVWTPVVAKIQSMIM